MSDAKPVYLFASARSGTHLLRSVLAQSDGLCDLGEVFNPWTKDNPHHFMPWYKHALAATPDDQVLSTNYAAELWRRYLDEVSAKISKPWMLFDLKVNALRVLDLPFRDIQAAPLVIDLIRESQAPVIVLTRKDRLAQACSYHVAFDNQLWVKTDQTEDRTPETIRADPAKIVEFMWALEASERSFKAWFHGMRNFIWLTYEDLLAGDALAAAPRRAVEGLLGVDLSGIQPATHKILRHPGERIENFDEVVEIVAQSPHKAYAAPYLAGQLGREHQSSV